MAQDFWQVQCQVFNLFVFSSMLPLFKFQKMWKFPRKLTTGTFEVHGGTGPRSEWDGVIRIGNVTIKTDDDGEFEEEEEEYEE